MLGDIALLLVGAVLVNNFVLVQFPRAVPLHGRIQQIGDGHGYVGCDNLRADPGISLQLSDL